ncbi:MAG: SDR family oxidoreductase [Lachnospiraceae bacterium]|nr:SDR family oxidoreductase [Lachnospiraceae bacterium]
MIHSKEELSELFSIKDKVAVVTGGGSGIGLGIAMGYAAAGANVILIGRSAERLESARNEGLQYALNMDFRACNVSNEETVEEVFDDIIRTYGRIDVLVNSAGDTMAKPAEETTAEDFRRILDVNVVGLFNCCKYACLDMMKRDYGKIINIGSARGEVGVYTGTSAYGASKGAVHMLTKQLATEWAKYHINVNCLIPNLTKAPLSEHIFEKPDVYEYYISRIPMRRYGTTDDFVGIALYFASAASDFITGQLFFVDGGSMAG